MSTLTAFSSVVPGLPPYNTVISYTSSVIDATGERVAWIGPVWNASRATKSVRKVHFLFGTVTKSGGSALTVSLQNVSTAAGNPTQPDEVQDQTVAIANADANFASDTWYTTGALSADRSVAFGELLAVVVEYDGSGRLVADAVNFKNIANAAAAIGRFSAGGFVLKTASYAIVEVIPNVLLEFSDGTFGTLGNPGLGSVWPASAVGSIAFNSGSAADEVALEFTVPVECKCDGAWITLNHATTADYDIVLYEGTTPKATVSIDGFQTASSGNPRPVVVNWPEVTLAAGTTYYLAVKPTTANSVTLYTFDVAAAGHFTAHAMGTSWKYNTRVDAGAWGTANDTRRPVCGLSFSAVHDGSASGGGMVYGNLRGFTQ